MADLYSILGVSRDADEATIKRAYRKLAKELHPDKNADDPKTVERFKQVTSAYDILSDKAKRGAYDRGEIDSDGNPRMPNGFGSGFGGGFGSAGGGFRPGAGAGGFEFRGDPNDLFSELFGDGRKSGFGGGFRAPPVKGADVSYRLSVPFVDAALARTQRLRLGSGKTIDLKIPQGVKDGQSLRLTGQGEQGPGGPGDAIVTLSIQPDERFTRDGDDIRADIMVPLATAVLGGKQQVPTPDGDVMLTIAPGSNSGKLLRLKGKGWTRKNGTRGDMLVRILVDVPADSGLADFLRQQANP